MAGSGGGFPRLPLNVTGYLTAMTRPHSAKARNRASSSPRFAAALLAGTILAGVPAAAFAQETPQPGTVVTTE